MCVRKTIYKILLFVLHRTVCELFMSFLGYQIGDMLTSITANKFQVMLHEKIIIDRGKKKGSPVEDYQTSADTYS